MRLGKRINRMGKEGKPRDQLYLFVYTILIIVAITLVISNIVGFYRENTKYLGDASVIGSIARGERSDFGDKSYGNVAWIYRIFGLSNNFIVGESAVLSLFLIGSITSLKLKRDLGVTIIPKSIQWLYIFSSIILFSIYFRVFTKEIVPLVINLFVGLLVSRSNSVKKTILLITIINISYAFFFRTYWSIFAFLFIMFYLADNFGWLIKISKRIAFLGVLFLSLALTNSNLLILQDKLNERRIGSEYANSAFTNIPTIFNGLLTWPFKIIAFIFPFPFIQKPNIQLTLACINILLMFYCFLKIGKSEYFELWKVKLVIFYLISYVLTLGIFEPDYGSFTKHMAGFLPLIFRLITLNLNIKPTVTFFRNYKFS